MLFAEITQVVVKWDVMGWAYETSLPSHTPLCCAALCCCLLLAANPCLLTPAELSPHTAAFKFSVSLRDFGEGARACAGRPFR